MREPEAEARVRDYLKGQGYIMLDRTGQHGGDVVAVRDGRRLLVEVKADRPAHLNSRGTIYVDGCTLLGQIVLRKGQGLAHEYAIAIRPVHSRLIAQAASVLASIGLRILLVEDQGVEELK